MYEKASTNKHRVTLKVFRKIEIFQNPKHYFPVHWLFPLLGLSSVNNLT